MPEYFLIASAAGLLFVLNAVRATRFPLIVLPAFFASWLTIELAPHLLVLHIVGVGFFLVRGAAAEWPGWVALGLSAVSGWLLWSLVRESYRVHEVLDEALSSVVGPVAAHTPVVWREFVFPFKLWSRKIRRVRDIPYVEGGRRRRRLDIWHPREEGQDRPCFLYVPGGAWIVGVSNKNQQGKPLLIEMASRGWVCFSMNYPLSPRSAFPAHIIAVKQAIAWIRANAHNYGGDASFLMIGGNSAGGHLSSLAALTPNDPAYQPGFEDADTTVQAAAPLYGVYDFTGAMLDELPRGARRHKLGALRHLEFLVVRKRLKTHRDVFEQGSPWHRVGAHAPPFLIIHGAMDTLALVEEARAFAERLRESSSEPVIYAELPRTQHAFDHFLSIRTLYAVRSIARFGEWAYERWKTNDAPRAQPSDRAAPSPTSQP